MLTKWDLDLALLGLRFTERLHRIILSAHEEAARTGSHVEPEHLLLALLREKDSVGYGVLLQSKTNLTDVQNAVEASLRNPNSKSISKPGLTRRSKHVLVDFVADEARRMNHHYIGSEHLLLGLLRENDGVSANALRQFGLDLDTARREVKTFLETGDQLDNQAP